jgi:hypothetical protein
MFFGLETIKRVKVYYATTISLATRGVNARCHRRLTDSAAPLHAAQRILEYISASFEAPVLKRQF